jgi:hypothetical protein
MKKRKIKKIKLNHKMNKKLRVHLQLAFLVQN